MPRFDLNNYVTVQERIVQFWKDHPDGAIRTQLESPSDNFDTCRYSAAVFINRTDALPAATGWAFEKAGGGGPNATSHEENGETSAIGRALANLGYATSQKDRPSREEMGKVQRAESAPAVPPTPITLATQKDLAALHATASEAGITHEQLHAWAAWKQVESLRDVESSAIKNLTRTLKDKDQAARFTEKFPKEARNGTE